MTTWRDKLPPVSDEDWAATPPSVRARVQARSKAGASLDDVGDALDAALVDAEVGL